jgi:hypothetical protein
MVMGKGTGKKCAWLLMLSPNGQLMLLYDVEGKVVQWSTEEGIRRQKVTL